MRVVVAGNKRFFTAVIKVDRPAHAADIAAVDVNADRGAVTPCIADAVDIAHLRRHRLNRTWLQPHSLPVGLQAAFRQAIALRNFGTAQHADQPPDAVIVYRRGLARPPDKAHHRKALLRVGIQQVLLVARGIGLGELIGQPVINAHQLFKQCTAVQQDLLLLRLLVEQARSPARKVRSRCGLLMGFLPDGDAVGRVGQRIIEGVMHIDGFWQYLIAIEEVR